MTRVLAASAPRALGALLRGVLAFPITPYSDDGAVDLAAVHANARWLAGSGMYALVAPSGTGELFSLTPDECAAIVRATVEAAAGRIPVIAGVGFGPRVAAELARQAERDGADGILVLPPYYAHPDPDGLVGYYRQIAEATALGVAIYARDGVALTPALLERLAREIPNLVAFKDGRGDVRLFQRLREHVSERLGAERLVWLAGAGDDMVGPYFAAGAEGFTSSLAWAMIVGAASMRPSPAGGPGAFTLRNSSKAAEASGVDSPLPNHWVGHWGVPQPESASRSSQVRSGMSRSKFSSRNARTALRTASGVVRSADVMTGPYRTTFGLPRVVVQEGPFAT